MEARVAGFDTGGEAMIRKMPDGSLWLVLNTMPPSDARVGEEDLFDRFDTHLQDAIGVPVIWDDRERFVIPAPADDTAARIVHFLQTCRKKRVAAPAPGKSARAMVLSRLGELFSPAGFRKGERSAFSRSIPQGRQVVSMAWIDRKPQCAFTLTLGIRLDAVEELAGPFLDVSPADAQETPTTLTQLEHFGFEPQLGTGVWFPISGPADVDAAFDRLAPAIRDQIIPFFDRYQSPLTMAGALLPNPSAPAESKVNRGGLTGIAGLAARLFSRKADPAPQPTEADAAWARWRRERSAFDSSFHPSRAIKHLVLAHLTQNPRIEDLVRSYREELSAHTEPDREKLERAIQFIEQRRRGA